MIDVDWIKFRDHSGARIKGTVEVPLPQTNRHMDRAYYLTAKLEAPKFGGVQSYDGAAMSGGPMHNIAVYPRYMKQGSMFPLLRYLERHVHGSKALRELWKAYKDASWYIAQDGKLRGYSSGAEIKGLAIQNEFTPYRGRVPRRGWRWKQAKQWALLHHELFADPDTFSAQREFAIKYLIDTQRHRESKFYRQFSEDISALPANIGAKEENDYLSGPEDLAMCVYHSFSVNGPAPAKNKLLRTLNTYKRGKGFAYLLIWLLGTSGYGRWHDTRDNRNRYDRTRYHARKSGLWPAEYFAADGFMPPNLPRTRPA